MNAHVERQIADLRLVVASATRLRRGVTALAMLSLLGAIVWWHPWPLMAAAFLGFFALVAREAEPRLAAALVAYDGARPSAGEAVIGMMPDRDTPSFRADVHEAGQAVWAFEFIPVRWSPTPGVFTANIWRDTTGTPVLVTVESGLLVPRYAPTLRETPR